MRLQRTGVLGLAFFIVCWLCIAGTGYATSLFTITDPEGDAPPYTLNIADTSPHNVTFTVKNTSGQSLTFYNVGISQGDTSKVSMSFVSSSSSCYNKSISSGGTCTMVYAIQAVSGASGTYTIWREIGVYVNGSWYKQNATVTGTITATPQISISPTSKNYGNVNVGSSASQTFTVSNTGSGTLSITSVTLSNTTNYTITSNNCSSVAAGGSCSITVRFNPKSYGTKSATLTIKSNATNASTLNVSLTGVGVGAVRAVISVSPTSKNYGNVNVGSSASQTFTVSNTGNTTLSVSSVILSNTADYTITSNGCSSVAAGGSCSITVRFNPKSHGTKSATLTIKSNAYNAPTLNVSLTGVGVGAEISISPTSKNYGSVNVGSSVSQTFTVSNTGNATLTVSSVTLSDTTNYTITSNNCSSVAAGSSCSVAVMFNPKSAGTKNATLKINSNAYNASSLDVSLTGIGNGAVINVTPTSKNYGNVKVGTQSADEAFTISNSGNIALTISSVTLTDTTNFKITSNNCSSVAAGANCTIKVRFTPASVGTKTATLKINSNAYNASTVNVSLSGVGTIPDIVVTPTSLNFGNQLINTQSTSQTITITNQGTADLVIGAASLTGSDFLKVSDTCSSKTIAPGATCSIKIAFKPASVGAKTGQVTIPSDDPDTPTATVSLSGTGIAPDIQVSPTSIDFGNQQVGTASSQKSITVKNVGSSDLHVGTVSINGPFSIAIQNCANKTLAVNASCTIAVVFAPTATGTATGKVSIASDDPDTPSAVVNLTGVGVQPVISVNPTDVDFGSVVFGTEVVRTITVSNAGPAGSILSVTNVIMASPKGNFKIKQNECAGLQLGATQSCQIQVAFAPMFLGETTATLSVTSSDPDHPSVDVSLHGVILRAKVSVNPSSLDFGNYYINEDLRTQTVTVSNIGDANLVVSNMAVQTSDYVVSNECTSPVAPGGSCTLTVTFSPGEHTGKLDDTLSFTTNDPESPNVSIPLTGYVPRLIDLGVISIPAVSGSLKRDANRWPFFTPSSAIDSMNPSDYVPVDIYAKVVSGGIPVVLNGVELQPDESVVKVAEQYDLSQTAYLNFPIYSAELGTADVYVMVEHELGLMFHAQVQTWKPALELSNDRNWQVVQRLDTTTVSVSNAGSAKCSLTTDVEQAASGYYTGNLVCEVRFTEYPEALSIVSSPLGLTGYVDQAGEHTVTMEVAVYDASGQRHVMQTVSRTLTASEPPAITFSYEPTYLMSKLGKPENGAENEYFTHTGENVHGRVYAKGSYPGIVVKFARDGEEYRTGESYSTQFSDYITTNIDTLWAKQTVTVTAYYKKVPEVTFSQDYVFQAIPKQLSMMVNTSEGVSTSDTTVTGFAGTYLGGGKYVYSPDVSGVWSFQLYGYKAGQTRDDAVPLGSPVTDVSADGRIEINVGQLEPGIYRVFLKATYAGTEGDGFSSEQYSPDASLVIRNGSPVIPEIRVVPQVNVVPFYPLVAAMLPDISRFIDVASYKWYVSDDGVTWTELEGETKSAIRGSVTVSGMKYYKVRTVNRWSGLEGESQPAAVQGYAKPKIAIEGPNATVVGHPITLRAVVEGVQDPEITWVFQDGTTLNGETVTYTPQQAGNLIVTVTAKEPSAPEGTKTYYIVKVQARQLYKPVISGSRYVESGKEYTYTVTIPNIFPRGYESDLVIRGKWVLPDGTEIPDADAITYTPLPSDKMITFKYEVWIEQYPDVRASAEFPVQVWTYEWPEWKVITSVADNRAPADIRLQVIPASAKAYANLGGEKISYEFLLPPDTELVQSSGAGAIVRALRDGNYQFSVRVYDTRGNVAIVQSDVVTVLPSPELAGGITVVPSDRWNRAPTDVFVQAMVTSVPKADSLDYVNYIVDGNVVVEHGGSVAIVSLDTPGDHTITAEFHSKNGAVATASKTITLVQGDKPQCRIEQYGDGISALTLKGVCSVEMGYVASYQWFVNGEETPFKAAMISFAQSDLQAGVRCARLVATTDKGQVGEAVWGTCE